jgi:hypothetical protein
MIFSSAFASGPVRPRNLYRHFGRLLVMYSGSAIAGAVIFLAWAAIYPQVRAYIADAPTAHPTAQMSISPEQYDFKDAAAIIAEKADEVRLPNLVGIKIFNSEQKLIGLVSDIAYLPKIKRCLIVVNRAGTLSSSHGDLIGIPAKSIKLAFPTSGESSGRPAFGKTNTPSPEFQALGKLGTWYPDLTHTSLVAPDTITAEAR